MKERRKVSRVYKCKYAPFVTNWSGTYLDRKIRDKLKLGDIVRVMLETNDESMTRYIIIKDISDKYLKGTISDPYNGQCSFKCNICHTNCNLQVWTCTNGLDEFSGNNKCNYQLCDKCYEKYKHLHNHPFKLYKHKYCDGTIITFKKTSIMEIPNWTPNTTKLIEKYKQNYGRLFTGAF